MKIMTHFKKGFSNTSTLLLMQLPSQIFNLKVKHSMKTSSHIANGRGM